MAIFLARGGRSFTTCPPMRISPEVWVSSPAIIRSSVVFPQPDGPRKTRNSPSFTERSTPSTAFTSPKCFLTFLVSTVAIEDQTPPVRTICEPTTRNGCGEKILFSYFRAISRIRGTLVLPGWPGWGVPPVPSFPHSGGLIIRIRSSFSLSTSPRFAGMSFRPARALPRVFPHRRPPWRTSCSQPTW